MTLRYGWEGAVGIGEESTWGVAATISRFEEHASVEIGVPADETVSRPGISTNRVRLLTQTKQGRKPVSWSLQFDLAYKGLAALFLKHAMGAIATVQDEVAVRWTHTISRADILPVGLTLEAKIAPDFYKLVGCKVNEVVIESDTEGPARMTVSGFAKDYTIAGTGATYTPPAAQILTVFHEAAFTIDTVSKQYRAYRLRIFNDLKADDFRSGSRTVYTIDPRDFMVEGSVTLTAEEVAQLLKIRDFATADLQNIFTGPTLGAGTYKWDLDTPKVRYGPAGRRIGGPQDEVLVELPFAAFKDTEEPLIIKLSNNTATP